MKNIRTFLFENAAIEAAFSKAQMVVSSTNYGKAEFGKLESRKEKFLESLKALHGAVKGEDMYNSDFKDHYTQISRYLESLYDYYRSNKYREHTDFSDPSFSINGAKKYYDFWSKKGSEFQDMIDLGQIGIGIKDAVKMIKPALKSGKKPKVDPKTGAAPYAPKVASYDVQKQVVAFLRDAVSTIRAKYISETKKSLDESYKRVKDLDIKSYSDIAKIKSVSDRVVAQKIYTRKFNDWIVVENYDDILQKMSEQMVDEILDNFVGKNTMKISTIMEKKGFPVIHKILKNNISNRQLENEMYFRYADGAEFTIYSQVVFSYSKFGKPFIRVPTRFRNVKRSDGSSLMNPTEKSMQTNFY